MEPAVAGGAEELPVRVLFDDQITSRERRGGISRYTVSLVQALRRNPELRVCPDIGWRWSHSEFAVAAGLGVAAPGLAAKLPAPLARRPLLRAANRLAAGTARDRADIVHATYYDPRYLSRRRGPRLAVTVHDMIPELLPELFPHGNPHLAKEQFVRRADVVLCISESTKADLLAIYGAIDAPIVVTPLAADAAFRRDAARPGWLPEQYLLYVGQRGGYKDFAVLLDAFALLAHEFAEVHLLAVGGGCFAERETRAVRELGLADRVTQRTASDQELAGVYAHAAAFVYPSRYEGFGMPTLEAMACGCPTVVARSSSHVEVGGDAAMFFAPGDAVDLATKLRDVLGDGRLSARLTEAGLVRTREFTWGRCAEQSAAGYRSAMAR